MEQEQHDKKAQQERDKYMCNVRMYLCVVYGLHLSLTGPQFKLFCVHPVSGERLNRRLEVHQDELMPVATKRAYEVNSQIAV